MIAAFVLAVALAGPAEASGAGAAFVARLQEAARWDREGRPGRAIRAYDEALRFLPPPPVAAQAFEGRGVAYFRLGLLERAVADLDLAVDFSENSARPRWLRAYAGLAAGHFDTAAEDGRFAARRLGARNPVASYAAILSFLASRGASSAERARGTERLAAASRVADPASWPAPLLFCLAGEIDELSLLSFASTSGERTEARAYLGIRAALAGDTAAARTHLDWVAQHGDALVLEHALARAWRARVR